MRQGNIALTVKCQRLNVIYALNDYTLSSRQNSGWRYSLNYAARHRFRLNRKPKNEI